MQISSSCIDLIISHILCKYHLHRAISCRLLKKVQETKQHENEYLLNYFDTVISCIYMNLEQLIFIYTSVEDISNFCSNRAWFTESNNNVFSVIVNIISQWSIKNKHWQLSECSGVWEMVNFHIHLERK